MSKTRVSVPKEVGDELTVAVAGGEPTKYRVTDGHVSVAPEDVGRFLSIVPGSEVQDTTSSKGA